MRRTPLVLAPIVLASSLNMALVAVVHADSFLSPEAPYPHTRSTGQKEVFGAGSVSGTFSKKVKVELFQYYQNDWHSVGNFAESDWTNDSEVRKIAFVACGGASQSYLWHSRVHGWARPGGDLGVKDSRIVRLDC